MPNHHAAPEPAPLPPGQRQAEVLLVATDEAEVRAVFAAVLATTGTAPTPRPIGDRTYYDLGAIGGARVWLVRSEEGSVNPGGAFATLYTAIGVVRPAAILLVGTAIGLNPDTQQLGDILIARQVIAYEPQRVGTQPDGAPVVIPRGDRASASTLALDRCKDTALHWPAERARVRFGPLLSGEKLLEHAPTAAALLAREPEAIGCEQQGVALYAAAHQHKLDWIVIKAVARWPHEGPADEGLAARSVAEFTVQMLARGGFAPAAWAASLPSQSPPPLDHQGRPGQVTITNPAPNLGAQGVFHGPVNIHHNHQQPTPSALDQPPTSSTLTARQRAELLDRLKLRYQELLDHALPHQVRLQLGLHTRPDAVDPAWRRMLLRGPRASPQPVPPDTPVLGLFDGQQGQLLVLGAPGAGKTTLIVELAQALTTRALADGQARIPVVLNVAAWRSGQSLRDWLAPTLRDLLGASKRFAGQLAASDDLLLLLDGLDEVAADHRVACVVALNAYLAEHDLAPPLVVGCRSREYTDMGARLVIAGAVELEPMELPAIEQALVGVPAAQGVLVALQTDELLRELATTPLMVNVLLLAHGGQKVPQIEAQTVEERRQMLWTNYVRRLFQQRLVKQPSQALQWLRLLAQQLRSQSETNFLIDDLQPTTLPSTRLRWWHRGLNGLVVGVVFGVAFGLPTNLTVGMISGSIVGLTAGLFSDSIKRREQQHWSWSAFWQRHRSIRLVFALSFGLSSGVIYGLIYGWLWGVVGGLLVGVGIGLLEGWQPSDLAVRIAPMQGLQASAKTGLLYGLIYGLALGLIGGSVYLSIFGPDYELVLGLVLRLGLGLLSTLIIGPFFGLFFGLEAFFQHYTLRFVLWRAGLFPFRAITFLNAMSERLLLERDGAFYRFRHLLLRDFIADLSDDDIARLAREIEGEGAGR